MLMFLPSELLTLVVLGTAVVAFPQDPIPVGDAIAVNATATLPVDTARLTASETPAAPDEEIGLCIIDPQACNHREIPELPTATGFEDTELNSPIVTPTTQANVIVTSNIPTIIDVQTNTVIRGPAASVPVGIPVASLTVDGNDAERNVGQPNTPVQKDIAASSGIPKQPVASPAGMIPSTAVPPNPQQTSQNSLQQTPQNSLQQTSQNSLLLDVVSRLGQTGSVAQPTSPSAGTTDVSGEDSPVNSVAHSQKDNITPGPGMPTATSPPSVTAGNSITLGSAVLTLTPGVSTTIGPNSDQTFIAITTNVAGSTLVTISSSGTAVTATVSTAPTILTLSKTGFEASITHGARPERYTGKLSTTTSSGLAVGNRRSEVGWWTSAILGFLPLVFGL